MFIGIAYTIYSEKKRKKVGKCGIEVTKKWRRRKAVYPAENIYTEASF
jgi:hypothetical protein